MNKRVSFAIFLLGVLILASASGIQLVRSEVGVIPSAGCFGVSSVIPGLEGAFAAIATDDVGGVYVAYQSQWLEDGSAYVHVYFAYSHDYGVSWSESFRVDDSDNASVVCDTPSIAVDPLTGCVFVAWKDNRTGVAKVYVDKSVDRGISFAADVLVFDWTYDAMDMGYPRTVNIEVGVDGKVYVAWILYDGDNPYDSDIFFAWSSDGGQVFSTPTNVNPLAPEARHYHPWIAVSADSKVYVAYCKRISTSVGVYLAWSQNGGVSFESPVKINDDTANRYRGGVQIAIAPNGNVHATWTDGRAGDGTQYFDIYYGLSSDGGASFSANIRVNDDSIVMPPDTHPHFTRGGQGSPSIVADSASRVHVVWEDFRNFVHESAYCRDTYYASSEDGIHFSMNIKVNSVPSDAVSVDNADPIIAIDSQDNLFIVYSDAPFGDNDHHKIYFVFAQSSEWQWTTFLDWVHYHNYAELAGILSALNDTYSDIVDVFSIGKSWLNRDIYCVRLTNENDNEPKPEVLFVGYHHAQEQISAELPLYFVVYAALNFGLNETVTRLLSECEIYVIVALNVDGFDLFEANDCQRKNARPIDEDNDGLDDEDPPEDENGNSLIEVLMNYADPQNPEFLNYEGTDNDDDGINAEDWVGGVDLNRNYPIAWESAVSDPSSSVYRGPAPFSEPETQAVRDLVVEHNFVHALSFHSGLEFVIYPWGCTADLAPDDAKFVEIAQSLSSITGGTQYASPTVMYGIWDDWMYGEAGVLAFTCEIFRNETWVDAVIGTGPYPNTVWEGGSRWLYNPFPSTIESVVLRWLPVFFLITDKAINEPSPPPPPPIIGGTTDLIKSDYLVPWITSTLLIISVIIAASLGVKRKKFVKE